MNNGLYPYISVYSIKCCSHLRVYLFVLVLSHVGNTVSDTTNFVLFDTRGETLMGKDSVFQEKIIKVCDLNRPNDARHKYGENAESMCQAHT